MSVTSYKDLPIVDDEAWDPGGVGRTAIENEILGDRDEPNWAKYEKAHLIVDRDNKNTKAGYKLIFARMYDGTLKANLRQLSAAVAVINGARGGVRVSKAEKRSAYNHAMRYYQKAGIPKKERPEFMASENKDLYMLGGKFELKVNADTDIDTAVWIQIARTGNCPGYDKGRKPFSLTKKDLEDMVRNLRAHPSYEVGLDGFGTVDIVHWDFNHSSEMNPAMGYLPIAGSPSQAWTRDLRLENGLDGEVKLMAYTRFLEPSLSYIKNKQYQGTSIAFGFNQKHPETNENIGTVLYSIALTNTPFLAGMDKLAASRRNVSFNVDVSEFMDALQGANSLRYGEYNEDENEHTPVIATGAGTNTVQVTLDKPVQVPDLEVEKSAEVATNEEEDDDMELVKTLSKMLSVRESDEAITSEIERKIDESAKHVESLSKLLGALGVSDFGQATEKIVALTEKGEELSKILPELEELRKAVAEHSQKSAEEDVDKVMCHRKLSNDLRESLMLYRTTNPEKFVDKYKSILDSNVSPLLTKTIAADDKGGQKKISEDSLGEALVEGAKDRVDVAGYPGRNVSERVESFILSNFKGSEKWAREDLYEKISDLKIKQEVYDSTPSN